jgi:heme oxygenase-like protein
MPCLPTPRGPVSEQLIAALADPPGSLADVSVGAPADPLSDDDLHLALYVLYELHYRGSDAVDERWEWDLGALALRAGLEAVFEAGLHRAMAGRTPPDADAATMDLALREILEEDDAPSLARRLELSGTIAQFREFLVHRSAYQLKEADPHSWAIPRLSGIPKAALIEIQADEYGGGDPARVHAQLFAEAMDALDLDARYGAYIDVLPGVTLATVNLMSLFGLYRRHRGAIVGHLALFEMTSSIPNRRYANALRRLGVDDPRATEFFDEHVTADAVHENVAALDLAGGLARQDPSLAAGVLFGARALVELDARWSEHLLAAWDTERSSLAPPAAVGAAIT